MEPMTSSATTGRRHRPRGQVLVIFAGALFLLMMMAAIVIDVSWYWVNSLRVQRAADAAALAGAVMLPNDPSTAYTLARDEAKRNGYVPGAVAGGNIVITPLQDGGNPRRLDVTISAPVGTFFMKVIGIPFINVTRTAKAEFTLPVPMGSPQNYYGVGILNVPTVTSRATGWRIRNNEVGNWTNAMQADSTISNSSSQWAASPTGNSPQQQWTEFGLENGANAVPNDASLEVLGIEVRSRAFLQGSGNSTSGCQMSVQLSWNNGNSWTTAEAQNNLPTSPPPTTPVSATVPYNVNLGSNADDWNHTWSYDDLTSTGSSSFRVRVTFNNQAGNCSNSRTLAIDTLEVQVSWRVTGPPTPQPVKDPYNAGVLAPQKFWGAMQSQGAPSVQGDAFMTGYETRKSTTNSEYHPLQGYGGSSQEYYDYGVELPGGGGEVWIYDPGFCDTGLYGSGNNVTNQGTGESWTVGGSNGADPARPVSAQYVLYDTNGTPYEYGDDPVKASSGSTFRRMMLSDPNLSGGSGGSYPGVSSCAGLAWHDNWWRLASGLPAGTYRLHTTSRIYNPFVTPKTIDGSDDQTDSTGLNAFAIWVNSSSGKPRVYGLGAMEAYFPLPGNQTSVFYLAQIDKVHAGKWVDIDLWDPGDTGSLSATLQDPGSRWGQRVDPAVLLERLDRDGPAVELHVWSDHQQSDAEHRDEQRQRRHLQRPMAADLLQAR